MSFNPMERAAKLLRLAENAGTEAEAMAAMERYQALATEHSILLAEARAHNHANEKPKTPVERTIQISEGRRAGNNRLCSFYAKIGAINGLKVLKSHDNTRVYAYGFEEDIEATTAMFLSLTGQMVVLSRKQASRARELGVSSLTARLSFYDGFVARTTERLREAREKAERSALAARHAQLGKSDSTELVLREKSKEVERFYRDINEGQRIGRGRSWNVGHAGSYRSGLRAGDSARLTPAAPALTANSVH